MSAAALRELRKAMVQRAFAPVYFLHGDDEFRKEGIVRDLLAAAVDPATRDFNFDVLRGADVSTERLESALHTPPMMADRRVVVLRDALALRKDARSRLDRYLAKPSRDTVLVLVAAAGAKGDKEIERNATAVAFPLLGDQELRDWVVRHAADAHGTTLGDQAAALLVENIGSDSGQLAAEVDKLASYTRGETIGEDAVREVVGIKRGGTLGDFLDRVAERDANAALALTDHVLSLPKAGLVPILMALTVQTMAMGWARQARDRGLPAQRLESEFFGLLKETGAYPMRAWGDAAKCWARNTARWDAASIERGLAALLSGDRAAKETRVSSDEQVLATVVYALCLPAGRPAA